MRICLATAHCNPLFIPLALLYIKSYLIERRGHPSSAVEIVEFPSTAESDDVAGTVLRTNPDVVGFSCYVWNISMLMEAVKSIKRARPHTRIVLGGPEVGPVAMSLLEAYPMVDVVVKSEGEIPFADLVRCLDAGGDLRRVNGICFRSGSDVVENADAPILADLNELPSPHLTPHEEYPGRIACIETQRGCVFKCNFCFYNKDLSVRNRRFGLDRVKEEIQYWLARDVNEIYLMDPVFNLYAERAKEICRFVAEHNDRAVKFHTEVWAEFIDDELAGLMRDGNFTFVEVGLQTTDVTALATVERRLKLDKFLNGIGSLKKHKIDFELQLIYGLPGETFESFRRSLEFAVSLDPPDLAVFPLMVLPGTELWHKADMLGIDFEPTPPYHVRSHYTMTQEQIDYGWKIVSALKVFGNSKTMRLLARERGVAFVDIVDAWIAWNAEDVQSFLSRFCRERNIPDVFYQQFAAREYRERASTSPS
jgi:anaerobic magnesium-protoporphyrin IX monomethyl ester cyclase